MNLAMTIATKINGLIHFLSGILFAEPFIFVNGPGNEVVPGGGGDLTLTELAGL